MPCLFDPDPTGSKDTRDRVYHSTIEQADRVIVMDQGELAESGSKAELLAKDGIYASMIKIKRDIEREAAAMPAA